MLSRSAQGENEAGPQPMSFCGLAHDAVHIHLGAKHDGLGPAGIDLQTMRLNPVT